MLFVTFMNMEKKQEWILLIHQLPAQPTNLRVRIWRKLQNFGAVSIKNSVYILPFNEKTNEDFAWLKQEIEAADGEATVFRSRSVEGKTDQEIIALFRRQRDEEYAKLIPQFEGLNQSVREENSAPAVGKLNQSESELGKLKQELEQITANDFFQAKNRQKAQTAYEKCLQQIQSIKGKSEKSTVNISAKLDFADYQNRRWVTRKDPHIDRLASGWLIKRFIDKRPRFGFVEEGEPTGNALTFDMVGANFSHQGEDCTFETLIKSFGLENDFALGQLAEIVHDIDLKDNKFNRLEAVGVNAVIRGISEVFGDDNERLKQSFSLFDGLYQFFQAKNS